MKNDFALGLAKPQTDPSKASKVAYVRGLKMSSCRHCSPPVSMNEHH